MNQIKLPYIFKHSARARQVRLTVRPARILRPGGVNCDATVVLTAPRWIPLATAEEFLRAKMDWVADKVRYWKAHPVIKARRAVYRYRAHKAAARQFVTERVNYYNAHYQFAFNRLNIKRGRSRWGSCSAKRNLNFNFKLLWLPRLLADYVMVHELCHLQELNHSNRFWALVAQTMPEYKKLRGELKTHQT